jgi:transposase
MPRVRSLPRPRPVPRGPLPTAPRPPLAPLDSALRRRNCELDVNLRTQITTLRETAEWSYGDIYKKFPNIPLLTIKTTCLRSRIRHKEESLKRSGRPKILDENDRQKILEKIHEEPQVTYDDLLSEVNNKCKKDSIAHLLYIEGLNRLRQNPHTGYNLRPAPEPAAGLGYKL